MSRVIAGRFPALVRPVPSESTRVSMQAFIADMQVIAGALPYVFESFAAQALAIATPLRAVLRAEALADDAATTTGHQ